MCHSRARGYRMHTSFGGEGHVGPSPSSRHSPSRDGRLSTPYAAAPTLRFGPAGDRAVPPRQGFGMLFGDRTGPQGDSPSRDGRLSTPYVRSPKSMSTKGLSRAEGSRLALLGATPKGLGLDAEHGTGTRGGSCWRCAHPLAAFAGMTAVAIPDFRGPLQGNAPLVVGVGGEGAAPPGRRRLLPGFQGNQRLAARKISPRAGRLAKKVWRGGKIYN